MPDKCLHIFDEYAAECEYLCSKEEKCTSSSWGDSKMYSPGPIENSQTDGGCQPE